MGTTTIEITDAQKERLKELKRADREAMKTVVGRVLDAYESDSAPVDGDATLADLLGEDEVAVVTHDSATADRLAEAIEGASGDAADIREELQALRESVDSAPERTADELEGRFR